MTAEQQAAATEAKRSREAAQFFSYQRRIVRSGLPEPGGKPATGVRSKDDPFWRREEAALFKAEHVSAGINFKKYDNIPVEREGSQAAEGPVESFQEYCDRFQPAEELVSNIQRCGYDAPTPVQKHAMSASSGGTDVMVSAQTGSGKTAAFLVPTVAGCLQLGAKPLEEGPQKPTAIVMAPTRELCQQIAFEARRLCFRSACRVVSIYGGADAMRQLQSLAEGCELAICTPGRLDDFIERGVISMTEVKYLVLDEADRMLDMGFEPQIRRIIEGSGMPIAGSGVGCRQTMMFSATFPREIQELARDFLARDYLKISVGRVGSMTSSIEQRFEDVTRADEEEKFQVLLNALTQVKTEDGGEPKTIVFANQKSTVSDICWRLSDRRIRAREIHGGLSQSQRDRALSDLKTGRANVLVATDVAARGLDLPGIDHVINFELANSAEDYVHRIGRTGRIGNTGVATSLITYTEPALKDIVISLKKQAMEDESTASPVPDWMESLASARGRGGYRGGGGYQGRGGGSRPRSAPPRYGGGGGRERFGGGGRYGGGDRYQGGDRYGGGERPRSSSRRGGPSPFGSRRSSPSRSFGDDDFGDYESRF